MEEKKINSDKAVKKTWKKEDEEILIVEWAKYECLFKTNSSDFKRIDKKQAAREAIRKAIEEETGNLFTDEDKGENEKPQDSLRKELGKTRASKTSGTGRSDIYTPSWKWFKMLGFLCDNITPIKTKPTPGIPQLSIEDDEENKDPQENEKQELETASQKAQPSNTAGVTPTKKPNSKCDLESIVLEKSISVLEDIGKKRTRAEQDEDGDVLFGRHVCCTLKEIKDKKTKEMVKLKIQQLLFEAQFANVWDSPFSSFGQYQ